jgi:hypothetical protein
MRPNSKGRRTWRLSFSAAPSRDATGLEIDHASYARIDDDYVGISCPYCKEPHPLASVKSWLEDASAFETRVN